MATERYELERDDSELGQEFGGWKVTKFWERGTQGGWQVVFRGDLAEADEFYNEQVSH